MRAQRCGLPCAILRFRSDSRKGQPAPHSRCSVRAEVPVERSAQRSRYSSAGFCFEYLVRGCVGGRDEDGAPSEVNPRLDVAHSVADVERLCEVHALVLVSSAMEEECTGLSAFTALGRGMRAMIRGIDACPAFSEELVEAPGNALVLIDSDETAADPGLIRNQYHRNKEGVDPGNRFGSSREQLHFVRVGQVVRVLDNRTISIEEHCCWKRIHSSEVTTAAVNCSSYDGGTLRRSRKTVPSLIRPTTGISPRRSFFSTAIASPSIATENDGMSLAGKAPPPALASDSTISDEIPADCSAD